jgi:glucose/arabinose dehydrogenase
MNINKNDTAVLVTDPQNDIFISRRPRPGRWMRVMTYPIVLFTVCALSGGALAQQPSAEMPGMGPNPTLPQPDRTSPVRKYSHIVGWTEGRTPAAPQGFRVTAFASGLESPRWLYVLPNGDVLVAEARSHPRSDQPASHRQGMIGAGSVGVSANRITLLRDADGDGVPETRSILLQNLNQPLGMALVGDTFFVANTDGVMRFPYKEGQTGIEWVGEMILPLPFGGYNNHWTRNILASRDGRKLYVSVGSASNVGEYGLDAEIRRANILEINLDGSGERIFASGLRNPVGMAWEPTTGALWTAVNERDGLGDDLVPDYITSVRENGFYGWPYSYFGQNKDPDQGDRRPDLVARAIVPDYALGSHTASLGLAFYTHSSFPERYRGGAFVGQRGSWNRSRFSGYKVVFVPFHDGKPAGPPEDFLTGFMANPQTGEAHGRPVGVAVMADGSLLVADDAGNTVWRVQAAR